MSAPGQNRFGEPFRDIVPTRERTRRGDIGDVHDQRVEARPAFGGEDRGDRAIVGGDSAQAIDGLGGKRDQPARAQGLCRLLDLAGAGAEALRHR